MQTIVVVGAGMMGAKIATVSSLSRNKTVLVDTDQARADAGMEEALRGIDHMVAFSLVSEENALQGKQLISSETRLDRVVPVADVIIEAVTENLGIKQELFHMISELAPPSALITSNTSGLRISDIAKFAKHPERTATTHFWFPAHLVPLVEIVMGEHTAVQTAEALHAMLTRWGKTPVTVCKDFPGQLANRILQAIIREAVHIVESGLASPEDVDTAIKAGMAVRFPVWGPLEHIDAVGLDLALSVQKEVLPYLNSESTPGKILERLCAEGNLGWKSGKGFYDWHTRSKETLSYVRDCFVPEAVKAVRKLSNEAGAVPEGGVSSES